MGVEGRRRHCCRRQNAAVEVGCRANVGKLLLLLRLLLLLLRLLAQAPSFRARVLATGVVHCVGAPIWCGAYCDAGQNAGQGSMHIG